MNKNNYRQYYMTMLEIELPKEIEVHHINGDRKDNNLKNLVALPRKLHKDFHAALNRFKYVFEHYDGKIPEKIGQLNHYEFYTLQEYLDLYRQCDKYIDERNWCFLEVGLLDNPYGKGEIRGD